MFLQRTIERNPKLIATSVTLHQTGEIPPNTYVIDVDALIGNTIQLSRTAKAHGMELYFMSKQLGRLPKLARYMVANGIDKAVAVDFDEGKLLADHGVRIGNIGHLVQPGKHQWQEVLSWKPEVVTVFSYLRAKQVSDAAQKINRKQDILLKVVGPHDYIHEAQEGGIELSLLNRELDLILRLPGVRVVGVTTFPILKLADDRKQMVPTENLTTLLKGKQMLETKGVNVLQVNGPGGTSSETIPYLVKQGVTHGEPGHGLTGTTPLQAYQSLSELPAMVYVTEVSHETSKHYHVIAGGFYGRSNMKSCIVGHDSVTILQKYVATKPNSPEVIDYYGAIKKPKQFKIQIGDTAIFAFRTQIFVTRAHVALVEGIQSGLPRLVHLERKW
ncbi:MULTISPECIES: alanine racemase [Clostridia]|uniref:alanine racemase n=1 Tax=Clostridia TaxID=186801 RepID=UPI000EA03DAB|nr:MULTISPECIES: alanine racemase [Clostridia]NBJ70972.1 YhfX family PLP-dependent enzyme [Roseburia sp. 1XD42-34]RKI75510.1 YhfX family PLP-dependent enzyme [Clostridium sp. 1xD42-85]